MTTHKTQMQRLQRLEVYKRLWPASWSKMKGVKDMIKALIEDEGRFVD